MIEIDVVTCQEKDQWYNVAFSMRDDISKRVVYFETLVPGDTPSDDVIPRALELTSGIQQQFEHECSIQQHNSTYYQ